MSRGDKIAERLTEGTVGPSFGMARRRFYDCGHRVIGVCLGFRV